MCSLFGLIDCGHTLSGRGVQQGIEYAIRTDEISRACTSTLHARSTVLRNIVPGAMMVVRSLGSSGVGSSKSGGGLPA